MASHMLSSHYSKLSDELVLHVLGYLEYADLASVRRVSSKWRRLADDQQLWKRLYLLSHPHPHPPSTPAFRDRNSRDRRRPPPDFRHLFKLSHNWRVGRCSVSDVLSSPSSSPARPPASFPERPPQADLIVQLWRGYVLTVSRSSPARVVRVHRATSSSSSTPTSPSSSPDLSEADEVGRFLVRRAVADLQVDAAAALDGDSSGVRLAVAYDDGSFDVLRVALSPASSCTATLEHAHPAPAHATRADAALYTALHSPFYLTCTERFRLSVYQLVESPAVGSSSSPAAGLAVKHLTTFHSPVAWHPAALHISRPSPSISFSTCSISSTAISSFERYTATIAYASPLYPASWTVAAQTFSLTPSTGSVSPERSASAVQSWSSDGDGDAGTRAGAGRVTGLQTDGKWVVMAREDNSIQVFELLPLPSPNPTPPPSSPSPTPALAHRRTLLGHHCAVSSVAVRSDRCVSGGSDGRVKVWSLFPAPPPSPSPSSSSSSSGLFPSPSIQDDDPPAEEGITLTLSLRRATLPPPPSPASFGALAPVREAREAERDGEGEGDGEAGERKRRPISYLAFDEDKIVSVCERGREERVSVWRFDQ